MEEKKDAPKELPEWRVTSAYGSHVLRRATAEEAVASYRNLFIVPADIEVTATPHE